MTQAPHGQAHAARPNPDHSRRQSAAMLAQRSLPGLLDCRQLDVAVGAHALDVQLLRFDPPSFDSSAFMLADITCPPAIRRSVQKRQADYFYGRLAARIALAETGCPLADVGIGPHRKPLWPPGVVGSITHGNGYAAATVVTDSRLRGIGIDIEAPIKGSIVDGIDLQVLCARERALLERHPAVSYTLAVALVFSAKESFFKALFNSVGHYFGFDAMVLESLDMAGGRMYFRTRIALCPDWPAATGAVVHFRLLATGEVLTAFTW